MASLFRAPISSADLFLSSRIDDSLKISDASSLTVGQARSVDLKVSGYVKRKTSLTVQASKEPLELTRELKEKQKITIEEKDDAVDPFEELKLRFLHFKNQVYLENLDHYQNLADDQAPKFMVIACADSRVCPSNILGFQPGEAFTIRNIANLVPPFQHGASEVSAGLEFAVNSLQVANILVVGHSRCGGIRALMSMKRDDKSKSFIRDWVSIGKTARLSTEAAAGNLNFEKQCKHCEKESLNASLLNLLTYPWIEERVNEGSLSLHGGYYDFTDCSFEKWTLVYRQGLEGGSKYAIKNRSFWS
ncbi:putative carbonic anhydrase [Dioscorea sansibarensis]